MAGRALLLTCAAAALLGRPEAHVVKHSCIHDKLAKRGVVGRGGAGDQSYPYGGRRLQTQTWAPIRIHAEFDPSFGQSASFTPGASNWVRTSLVPEAIARFSRMISTIPVSGGLKMHRTCLQCECESGAMTPVHVLASLR